MGVVVGAHAGSGESSGLQKLEFYVSSRLLGATAGMMAEHQDWKVGAAVVRMF